MECEYCGDIHSGAYGSGRFCSMKCARGFSTFSKRVEINRKVSAALSGRIVSDATKKKIGDASKGRTNSVETRRLISASCSGVKKGKMSDAHRQRISYAIRKKCQSNPSYAQRVKNPKGVKSIMDVSRRTAQKILKRMDIPCSYCGWNDTVGDIHHISGKKTENADSHDNLSYICPNCHRKAHRGLIASNELTTLSEYVGSAWLVYYYGAD